MKKVALVFLLAVFGPSLVLAWLALRSLDDQQFVIERQRSLLYQGITEALARQAQINLLERQHEFAFRVEEMLARLPAATVAGSFDSDLRKTWPLAQVGFVVTIDGDILCPSAPLTNADARSFLLANCTFLANTETAEVYWSANRPIGNQFLPGNQTPDTSSSQTFASEPVGANTTGNTVTETKLESVQAGVRPMEPNKELTVNDRTAQNATGTDNNSSGKFFNKSQYRSVQPQQKGQALNLDNSFNSKDQNRLQSGNRAVNSSVFFNRPETVPTANEFNPNAPMPVMFDEQELSKSVPAEAEFRQLIGDGNEGTIARFVDNKLNVLFWYRSPRNPRYIFGAQLALPRMVDELRSLAGTLEPPVRDEICIAILDDSARPVATSRPGFSASWNHPFVATEIGEALPHWEIAAYLLNPAGLVKSAQTLKLTLVFLVGTLVLAIGIGSWLIISGVHSELRLTRQKTDFVSNVSHELKTPLTSIRMFSELLAEDRVRDDEKRRSYLNIISAETARLTRLINNVLDFSRMERGEKKYEFRECDFAVVVRETAESYRPHLENNGFTFRCATNSSPLPVRGDCDALAQVIVNLLSNAEKYSGDRKEIEIEISRQPGPLPFAEARVMDRGAGVPRGSEEKIFEKFYRAHDSLSSGIQGSGLGLTLARQIARAHGGDVAYELRPDGGSVFALRLPLVEKTGAPA